MQRELPYFCTSSTVTERWAVQNCRTKPKRSGFDYCSRDCGREDLTLPAGTGARAPLANPTSGQRRYSSVLGF